MDENGSGKLSLIIPAYNEISAMGPFLSSLKETLSGISAEYEIIVVDDGSDDGTADLAESQGLNVIRHISRKGYGASLKTGVRAATGEYIAIIDADNTYRPEDIKKLLEKILEADMVVGERHDEKERPRDHLMAKRAIEWCLSRIFRCRVGDINSGLRVMRREIVLKYLDLMPEGFSFTSTITLVFLLKGFKILYMPIFYSRRADGSKLKRGEFVKAFITSYARVMCVWLRGRL